MTEELLAIAGQGTLMGIVRRDMKADKLSFHYESAWRSKASSYPLSLSMPLSKSTHDHEVVEAFLWGLLPDNSSILEKWGRRFQVSPRHAFKLVSWVGEECAGAIAFIRPDRLDSWVGTQSDRKIKWLNAAQLGERIQLLVNDHSASRTSEDQGYFSLAGAQPKTALHYDSRRKRNKWGVPEGNVPTTHILKPTIGVFDGFAENEHFCLALAGELGLRVADSEVQMIGGTPVIVVERYDRIRTPAEVLRVHQEDMCQALACPPQNKYQKDGGPGPFEIVQLIRERSSRSRDDLNRFLDAMIFNWLIANTDAHAKNYSLLLAGQGQVRLAPLYDLISSLPYPEIARDRRSKFAMKVGGKYRVGEIAGRQWRKLSQELALGESDVLARIEGMGNRMGEAVKTVADRVEATGLRHAVIEELRAAIPARATRCLETL